jgi:hypothetical protein
MEEIINLVYFIALEMDQLLVGFLGNASHLFKLHKSKFS